MSTDGVAELRVNQTTNQTFLGTVEPNVTLVKEGAATLGTGSVGANVRVEAGVLALTSPEACSYRVTVLTVGPFSGDRPLIRPRGRKRASKFRRRLFRNRRRLFEKS